MQTGELARRLDVPHRAVRYALERGHANTWVHVTDGSGHYRDLDGREAFTLGLLVKLTQAGVKAPIAQKVVTLVEEGLRSIAAGFGWDYQFRPFDGRLQTSRQWFADVAADKAFRIATDANPSFNGRIEEFNWTDIAKHRTLADYAPCVVIRIDLSRLARLVDEKHGIVAAPGSEKPRRR